mgnify:CR=1 FL=1
MHMTCRRISFLSGNGLQKVDAGSEGGPRAYLLQNASALALSSAICTAGVYLAKILGFQGGNIPCITVLVVLLATLCPSLVGPLAPAGETLAILLIQVMHMYFISFSIVIKVDISRYTSRRLSGIYIYH